MASYHCTVRVGKSGKAAAHASYILREEQYAVLLKRRVGERLDHIEHGNMPDWAQSRVQFFWEASDIYERQNGSTYRGIVVALPRELTPEQRVDLIRDFVRQEIGGRHPFSWAIHCTQAALDGGEQPHAHIMYSERTLDGMERDPAQFFRRYNAAKPENGGCRKDSAGTKKRLLETRARWAVIQNLHLAMHGHEARVDHRSLQARGETYSPERHLGAKQVKRLGTFEVADLRMARAMVLKLKQAKQEMSELSNTGNFMDASVPERQLNTHPSSPQRMR